MKLSESQQSKIYGAMYEEIMKIRISIRLAETKHNVLSPSKIDDILSKMPSLALDEILKA